MPRYFFNLRTDDELIRDDQGSEHADLDAAEKAAAQIGREIATQLADDGEETALPRCIEITDEEGRDLLYVVFWVGPELFGKALAGDTPPTIH